MEYYMPVRVINRNNSKSYVVNNSNHNFILNNADLITAEDIKAEGAKEYQGAINFVTWNMDLSDIKAIFANADLRVIRNLDCKTVVDKVKDYQKTPKRGEIWVNKETGWKVAIGDVDNFNVKCINKELLVLCIGLQRFKNTYRKVSDASAVVAQLREELEEKEECGSN